MFIKLVKGVAVSVAALGMFGVINMSANQTQASASKVHFSNVKRVATNELGKPYSYGAVGPNSFDCSGFTQYVMKNGANRNIVRTAQAQYDSYKHVKKSKIKKGDLVFFGSSKSDIYHVGIALNKHQMIDAQNRGVIIEPIHAPWWNLVGVSRPVSFAKKTVKSPVRF